MRRFLIQLNKLFEVYNENDKIKIIGAFLSLMKQDLQVVRHTVEFMKVYSYDQIRFSQFLMKIVNLSDIQDIVQDSFQLQSDLTEQSRLSINKFNNFDGLPDFAVTSYLIFNYIRSEYKEIVNKSEKMQNIEFIIIQNKVKQHVKTNTNKLGLWVLLYYIPILYFIHPTYPHLVLHEPRRPAPLLVPC